MKFGVTIVPRVSDWRLIVDLEAMGYDCAWAADSQMLYSDAYAVLALAAPHTSRIRLGTGVSVAGTRLAPVTAHSIATINELAPGRVFLGIGTGHTAMRVMGKDPMKAAAFRDYLRVLRALLHGEEVDYSLDGRDDRHSLPAPQGRLHQRRRPGADLRGGRRPAGAEVGGRLWRRARLLAQPDQGAAREEHGDDGGRAPPRWGAPCPRTSIPRRSAMPACSSPARR